MPQKMVEVVKSQYEDKLQVRALRRVSDVPEGEDGGH